MILGSLTFTFGQLNIKMEIISFQAIIKTAASHY